MTTPDWAPPGLDLTIPSPARVYDYFLGGAHNFAADREFADRVSAVIPSIATAAQANRAFVHRAVGFMVEAGIDQFLDLGSGIPTAGNVHETAQQFLPQARVLYVDHDPVAVAHSRLILRDVPGTGILQAEIQRPLDILRSPELAGLLDLSRPTGLLLASVLPFVPDSEHPDEAVTTLRAALAPGSMLAITHVIPDEHPQDTQDTQQAAGLYRGAADSMSVRTRDEIRSFFGDWELVDPGLVWTQRWRPRRPDLDEPEPNTYAVAGLARKPLPRG